ncbi:iron-containing alcohol dehydrogenase [Clostridium beijerinckii]|jgi:Alcohol dehydrogenase, class IV|uniref:Iron-containing alcohol dehydrogenase n=1 Tax=Clostridium beijerinckii TaxID=1520 RepID=A0AAW3WAX9_CLOBE|nr:iron-containing alcohol dehydrogenase [Clostridium beijerinckii]MBC2458598.1 iron-containing alcohol dehydrogenase [Clostridium beijerinckii]MBC2475985.1 iron-containing alcohol dehydrogenase [Clostridium beijerinckii]MCI1579300.1 iron-containing alcohol dehydrogenase [Clostridium beijerinckii]MCI1584388.1 iron-containing alcohol dehydrogenase [Clostridium beijerinckii]MCI1622512.1 iron-containing alcohol dehydrogenase [Clostridium beijerinckii]
MKFNYNLPVNIIFGRGKVEEVGIEVAKYGKKPLIVTGKNSTKKTGLLDKTISLLKDAGAEPIVFDKVEQNPLTTTAYAGAELAKESKCDVVLGIGGGSIMDAAKAIAFIALNDGNISDYIFGKKISDKALPIILVPTTCGTGSEGNGFAVLTNPENNDKKSLRSNAIVAKASIIDPNLMITMPKHILASVGFDALCHNMEAYLSKNAQPLTTMMALQGIELIGKNLVKAYNSSEDMEAFEAITWGSTLGGMVINTAGVSAPHGMEHPASGLKDIVHGRGLAALTPVIYEESISSAPEKFAMISRLLGGNDENDCVKIIRKLLKYIELETTLSEQGIKEEDIDWMAENCLKVSAVSMNIHPVQFGIEDIKRIYKKAL